MTTVGEQGGGLAQHVDAAFQAAGGPGGRADARGVRGRARGGLDPVALRGEPDPAR
ncbi:hypothetical protein [Umezawaea sp. Da 62-37]|uniref:hypothetical protein n=1 Tax=Umezawaea sp. Da 62-37 TaxID=3075927 RepID=UPI0028F73AA5|nr:hypothetical protein [Umezawaea sp. Da 62-37]WNV86372.1 hypothetical protein RM788_51065 [Umezawaea sp. Da 62-37]